MANSVSPDYKRSHVIYIVCKNICLIYRAKRVIFRLRSQVFCTCNTAGSHLLCSCKELFFRCIKNAEEGTVIADDILVCKLLQTTFWCYCMSSHKSLRSPAAYQANYRYKMGVVNILKVQMGS